MNKLLYTLGVLTACVSVQVQAFAQADDAAPIVGHTGGTNTGYYLGWDASTGFPLNIEHRANNQPIRFLLNNTERMRINAGNGFVGIGGVQTPRSLLHLSSPLANTGGGWRPSWRKSLA